MFRQRHEDAEPEGRYYVELVQGGVDLEGLDRENEGKVYADRQVKYQRDLQAALNCGEQRGWTLINVTSPTAFQAIQ